MALPDKTGEVPEEVQEVQEVMAPAFQYAFQLVVMGMILQLMGMMVWMALMASMELTVLQVCPLLASSSIPEMDRTVKMVNTALAAVAVAVAVHRAASGHYLAIITELEPVEAVAVKEGRAVLALQEVQAVAVLLEFTSMQMEQIRK